MVDLRGFDSRQASLPVARPDRGQQEPAQLPCGRNFSQQQQPSNAQRSEQQQPSDVQRGNLDPAAQPWQPTGSADTDTTESGAAASAAVKIEARRRKRGCRGNGALQRRKQQRTQEWRDLERNSRPAMRSMREQPGQPMRERPGPHVRPHGRACTVGQGLAHLGRMGRCDQACTTTRRNRAARRNTSQQLSGTIGGSGECGGGHQDSD